jgi:hypothetical protein
MAGSCSPSDRAIVVGLQPFDARLATSRETLSERQRVLFRLAEQRPTREDTHDLENKFEVTAATADSDEGADTVSRSELEPAQRQGDICCLP